MGTTSSSNPIVSFTTLRVDIPTVIPDYSWLANISIVLVSVALSVTFAIKFVEIVQSSRQNKTNLAEENNTYLQKTGIDIDIDKARLRSMERAAKAKFNTNCLKNANLFKN